jgi:hypothetical protein
MNTQPIYGYDVIGSNHDTDRAALMEVHRKSLDDANETAGFMAECGYRFRQVIPLRLNNGYPVPCSAGHISFVDGYEWFDRAGEVYRAPISACVMPDGYRCGRWESSRDHWNRRAAFVG